MRLFFYRKYFNGELIFARKFSRFLHHKGPYVDDCITWIGRSGNPVILGKNVRLINTAPPNEKLSASNNRNFEDLELSAVSLLLSTVSSKQRKQLTFKM